MCRALALVAMIAVLLLGCASTPSESGVGPVDLTGDWQLSSGTVDGAPFPVADDWPITLSVKGLDIGGRSPCNHYGGEVVVDAEGSRLELTSMTAMACEEPVMAAEAAFVAALPRIRGATRVGDRLTLLGPGVELAFDRLEPPPVAEIVGTDWVLESLVKGDAVSSPMARSPVRPAAGRSPVVGSRRTAPSPRPISAWTRPSARRPSQPRTAMS
jgi:heat shock protein HslJ